MEFKQANCLLSLFLSYVTLAVHFGIGPSNAFYIDHRQSPPTHDWSYTNQLDWRAEHKQCGLKVQSPIDIQRRYVIQSNLSISFYNYNQLTRFKISNAHHTIKLNPINNFQENLFGIKLSKHNQNEGDGDNSSSLPDVISVDEEAEAAADFTARNGGDMMLPVPKRAALLERIRNVQAQKNSQVGANQPLDGNSLGHEEQHSPSDGPPFNGAPTIKLSWLDDANSEFKLRDIHFHWGERRDNGSEHAIDGRRAAMEMHLVHIKHGLDKSKIGITSDSVTVIAVLIESYRKSNADFNPIVNALTRINMTNEAQEIEYKSINDLLPNTLNSFYAYSGSLTTPPCYQVVNWIVMSDRLYLNAKQIEMFRSLYAPPASSEGDANHSHDDHDSKNPVLIMPNTRNIQPLNNRTIMASFASLNRLEQLQMASTPYSGSPSAFNFQIIYQLISAAFLLTNLLKIDKIICYTTSLIYDVNCASSRRTTTT